MLCLQGLSCLPGLGRKPQARDATGWSGRLAEPREQSHSSAESRWAESDGAEHTAPATASVHVSQPSQHAALQLTLTRGLGMVETQDPLGSDKDHLQEASYLCSVIKESTRRLQLFL